MNIRIPDSTGVSNDQKSLGEERPASVLQMAVYHEEGSQNKN